MDRLTDCPQSIEPDITQLTYALQETRTRGYLKYLLGLILVLIPCMVSAQLRLDGLEHLYFERIAGPGKKLPSNIYFSDLAPIRISSGCSGKTAWRISGRPHGP